MPCRGDTRAWWECFPRYGSLLDDMAFAVVDGFVSCGPLYIPIGCSGASRLTDWPPRKTESDSPIGASAEAGERSE